jgi:hypothetical protein
MACWVVQIILSSNNKHVIHCFRVNAPKEQYFNNRGLFAEFGEAQPMVAKHMQGAAPKGLYLEEIRN